LGERVGWDHVLLGSDYPYDMAEADPVSAVKALGLTITDQRALLGDNARAFLGL
jgi:aminocarboxymuconate-semialdehyde decarboxylase